MNLRLHKYVINIYYGGGVYRLMEKHQKPELRGADKATYDSQDPDTNDRLDTQQDYILSNTNSTSRPASTNINDGDVFTFTNTTAYKYYVLHITANNGDLTYVEINEWGLYGDKPSEETLAGAGTNNISETLLMVCMVMEEQMLYH